jgi:ABC-type transport system involved in cytochrome c biogenesis permease subunit
MSGSRKRKSNVSTPEHNDGPVVGFIVRWAKRVASVVTFLDVATVVTVVLLAPLGLVAWLTGWRPSRNLIPVIALATGVWLVLLSVVIRSVRSGIRPPSE